jgi:hemerythrin
MKHALIALTLVVAVAVLLAGCGKSEEMKKIETALNTEVTAKHDEMMKSMAGLEDLTAQITTAVAKHDELVAKFPKLTTGHTTADLVAAQEKITAAKTAMEEWMKGFKPYDPEGKHEEVVAGLTATKDALAGMEKQFTEAMTVAKDALASHTKAADDLMAKVAKKKR